MQNTPIKYSIVVPVYNGSKTIAELCQQVIDVFTKMNEAFEIIFVEDGSADNSWQILKSLKNLHPDIKAIRLSENFGQYAATICGIQNASGKLIATIDDDLQYNPSDFIPMSKMLEDGGWLVVYGEPIKKQQPYWMILFHKIAFYLAYPSLTKKYNRKYFVSSFRIFKREVIDKKFSFHPISCNIDMYFYWIGSEKNIGFYDVQHFKRKAGSSQTSFFRKIVQYCNYFFVWWRSPLKFIAYLTLAILPFTIGILLLMWKGFIQNNFFYLSIGILLTILSLISASIFAIYLAKIYQHLKGRPYYVIAEKL